MSLPTIAEVRKAVVNVVGLASMVVTLGFLHGRLLLDVETGIAVATAVLHYRVKNAEAPAELGDPVFAPEPDPAPSLPSS